MHQQFLIRGGRTCRLQTSSARTCAPKQRRSLVTFQWLSASLIGRTKRAVCTCSQAFPSFGYLLLRKLVQAQSSAQGAAETAHKSSPLLIILSGPSGVGKDAVLNSLRKARPDLEFITTATTRSRRPGEVHGKDYLFVSKAKFEDLIRNGDLLEYAMVYGELKGVPRIQVESAMQNGRDVILRLDVQGTRTVRAFNPAAVCIFLIAESEAELVRRLQARKTEPQEVMLRRIQTAREECTHIEHFDYVVVNREGRLQETVNSICSIIDAEKLRVARHFQS